MARGVAPPAGRAPRASRGAQGAREAPGDVGPAPSAGGRPVGVGDGAPGVLEAAAARALETARALGPAGRALVGRGVGRRETRAGALAVVAIAAAWVLGGGGGSIAARALPAAAVVALIHLVVLALGGGAGLQREGRRRGGCQPGGASAPLRRSWGRPGHSGPAGVARGRLGEHPEAWREFVKAPEVERAWERLNGAIVQYYIYEVWYCYISPDREFAGMVRSIINGAFVSLASRGRSLDLQAILRDVCDLLAEQLELFRQARAAIGEEAFAAMPQRERDEAVRMSLAADLQLHPAARGLDQEYKVLRKLMGAVVSLMLENETDLVPLQHCIAREIMAASVMRPVAGLITTELLTGLLLKCLGVEGEPGDPPAEVDPADDVHIRAAESNNLEPVQAHMAVWMPANDREGTREIEGTPGAAVPSPTTLRKDDSMDIPVQTLESLLPQGAEGGRRIGAVPDAAPETPSPQKRAPALQPRPSMVTARLAEKPREKAAGKRGSVFPRDLSACTVRCVGSERRTHPTSGHAYVAYLVTITREEQENPGSFQSPTKVVSRQISRRFRNFVSLHRRLRDRPALRLTYDAVAGSASSVISRGDSSMLFLSEEELVEQRVVALDRYMKCLTQEPTLRSSHEVVEFLDGGSTVYDPDRGGTGVMHSVGTALRQGKKLGQKLGRARDAALGKRQEGGRPKHQQNPSGGTSLRRRALHQRTPSGGSIAQPSSSSFGSGLDSLESEAESIASLYDEVWSSPRRNTDDGEDPFRDAGEGKSSAGGERRSSASSSDQPREEGDEFWEFLGREPENREGVHVIGPLLNLVDGVFGLGKRGFLGRQLRGLARHILELLAGPAIDDLITNQLEQLGSPHTIARIIDSITDSLWPAGRYMYADTPDNPPPHDLGWWQCPPMPPTPEAEASAAAAREKLYAAVESKDPPAAVQAVLGKGNFRQGLQDLADLVQSAPMVKQIAYGALEIAFAHEFPEMVQVIEEVHAGVL